MERLERVAATLAAPEGHERLGMRSYYETRDAPMPEDAGFEKYFRIASAFVDSFDSWAEKQAPEPPSPEAMMVNATRRSE
jgi:hypothetical protein